MKKVIDQLEKEAEIYFNKHWKNHIEKKYSKKKIDNRIKKLGFKKWLNKLIFIIYDMGFFDGTIHILKKRYKHDKNEAL
ncbi:MAG: hypothetical protein ACE5KE_00250 [Methanosarcinales archaeon]